jgi:hypothetical protein
MNSIELPIIGSGSQPKEADGLELDFLPLPEAMHTYRMPELSPSLRSCLETIGFTPDDST